LLKTKEVKGEIRAVTEQLHEHSEGDVRVAPEDEPLVAHSHEDISSVSSGSCRARRMHRTTIHTTLKLSTCEGQDHGQLRRGKKIGTRTASQPKAAARTISTLYDDEVGAHVLVI
jgi:hypothetical protein